jgi:hypothetical protein
MASTSIPPPRFMVKDLDCSICSAKPAPSYREIEGWRTSPSRLLSLPLELRDSIYQQASRYEPREDFKTSGLGITVLPASKKLGFLLTCRQMYHEAHDLAFQAISFHLGSSWIQGRTRAVSIMREQLLGNMNEIEVKHLLSCHDSRLYQKLIKLPIPSVALLRTFSFYLCFDVLKINWTDYVFGQLRKLFIPFQQLSLHTITFYATKESPWGFSYRTICTFLELIGSMESLEHIQWFENTHKREGETAISEYRDRFSHNFGLDPAEFEQLGKYKDIAGRMRCTPVNDVTKTAVVSVNGKWCFDGKKDWEEGSSWRDVRVTIASFEEAKALRNAREAVIL